jgi:hypothetical protein
MSRRPMPSLTLFRPVDRRRQLLTSIGEQLTRDLLAPVVHGHGAEVLVKPKLSDLVEIGSSALDRPTFEYATKAHVDFAVVRGPRLDVCFAVEFDGPLHDTDPNTIVNDVLKDKICTWLGLPLLRIGADSLQSVNGYGIVEWLVDVYFCSEAFGFPDLTEWPGPESTFDESRARYVDLSHTADARLLDAHYRDGVTASPGAQLRQHDDASQRRRRRPPPCARRPRSPS